MNAPLLPSGALTEADLLPPWLSTSALDTPITPVTSTWIEHTPFALWLMDAARPRQLVELGALHGVSYFTFCQGAERLGGMTKCFAVDTWQGDEHTGLYGDEVFAHVEALNRARFRSFSTLLRRSFDDALELFDDGSIDVLHIDGLHTYEAVKHDWEAWLPKLSEAGVVLLHDTAEYQRDFGVHRLMRELAASYPSFEFRHGHGLGVVGVGSALPPRLRALFDAGDDPACATAVRKVYATLGAAVAQRLELQEQTALVARLRADIAAVMEGASRAQQERDAERARHAAEQAESRSGFEATLAALRTELSEAQAARERDLERAAAQTAQAREAEAQAAAEARAQAPSVLSRASARAGRLLRRLLRTPPRRLIGWPLRVARRRLMARRLAQSGLFDGAWYLARYEDVRAAGVDPLRHFITTGATEGRWPNPLFDTGWYVASYPDVRQTGANPLAHYLGFGAAEERDPNPLFDTDWYLTTYPDVRQAGANPLAHYLRFGAKEGRDPNPLFDADWYLSRYADVAAAGIDPLVHYIEAGAAEGRAFRAGFDPAATQQQMGLSDPREVLARLLAAGGAPVSVAELGPVAPSRRAAPPLADLAYRPLISVITPVYNVAPEWLHAAAASVRAQSYDRWEFCCCDDGSTNEATRAALEVVSASDDGRVRVVRSARNGGIAAATNAALEIATGEYVAFLDNDDELAPHALEAVVRALNADPAIDVLYSDEDKIEPDGSYDTTFHKPDWSPTFLRGVMYVGHLLVARRSLVEEVGGLDAAYDGVQDFELMLRLGERARKVHHIRDVLYHWRRIPGSVADSMDAKPQLGERQVAAVNAHLRRIGATAEAVAHPRLQHRVWVRSRVAEPGPRISIVIPTKDQPQHIGRCLDSIFALTRYDNFEVVAVDNGTTDPLALEAQARHPVRRVDFPERFNYSRANNLGVAAATGELLLLLNNDTEVLEPDWLSQMAGLFEDDSVGIAGPLLLYPNGLIQHAGVALGLRGTADHVLRNVDPDLDGYFGSLASTREVSAVTGACMMIRRGDYEAVGGLNELYARHYQDVDLCLAAARRGRRVLWTPQVRLIHYESASRGSEYDSLDRALLQDRWGAVIAAGDPYSRWEAEARGTDTGP